MGRRSQEASALGLAKSEWVRPKVLLVAKLHFPAFTRLCLELGRSGFDVRVIAPEHHAVHRIPGLATDRIGHTEAAALASLRRSADAFSPDLIVPGDEIAVGYLQKLRAQVDRRIDPGSRRLAPLLEASIGPPSVLELATHKSRLISLAKEEGLRIPETTVILSIRHLRQVVANHSFPMVVKSDIGFAGAGVRIVARPDEARIAYAELRGRAAPVAAMVLAARKLDPAFLGRLCKASPSISLQRYIDGRPANRAVACWRGQVLAGLSVETVQSVNATSPATVIRRIDSPEMTDAAARLVARLGLSGFVGFDFVLEAGTGHAYLIEMNARPTQICHLCFDDDSDMIGALFEKLTGTRCPRPRITMGSRTIALFPQEQWRDPTSEYLNSSHEDEPLDQPEFLSAYHVSVPAEPPDWLQKIRQHAGRVKRSLSKVFFHSHRRHRHR